MSHTVLTPSFAVGKLGANFFGAGGGYMPKRVLIHGGDPTLLDTRRQILSLHGFNVETVLNGSVLVNLIHSKRPDLLIVCSSLPPDLQERDVRAALAVQPKVKCLVIHPGTPDDALVNEADQLFFPFDGPERFVSQVCNLLTP
jgi:DNA-binding NtrC family response regulator